MTSDTVMLDAEGEDQEKPLELELHLQPEELPPASKPEEKVAVFDPVRCAELHNKIIEKILQIRPEWRPHVKRNLFNVPPRRFLLERETDAEGTCIPQEPVSENVIRDRIGGDMVTFFESIDIINIEMEHFHNNTRQVSYQTPFTPFFDSPNLGLLYDFSDSPTLEAHPYVIQLYPTSYIFAAGSQAGGIMFDMILGLAMFARPMECIQLPSQTSWIPMDIVLTEWLKMIEDEKVYWRDGELDERKWTDEAVDRALKEWNEYLNMLEKKAEQLGAELQRGAVQRMVEDEALNKWASTMNPVAIAFLRQARSPVGCINNIGPGLTYFNSNSFDAMQEAQKAIDWQITDDPEILRVRSQRLNTIGNGWLTTLIFPAIGEHSVLTTTWGCPHGNLVNESDLLNRNLGLYIIGESDSSAVIDHEGKTRTFQRRDRCPWSAAQDFPLADMFRAWKIMIETKQWKTGPNGVEDDYSWFARNRDIECIPNTRWNPNLLNADEQEIGELKNDWVQWCDPVIYEAHDEVK